MERSPSNSTDSFLCQPSPRLKWVWVQEVVCTLKTLLGMDVPSGGFVGLGSHGCVCFRFRPIGSSRPTLRHSQPCAVKLFTSAVTIHLSPVFSSSRRVPSLIADHIFARRVTRLGALSSREIIEIFLFPFYFSS